MEKEFAELLKNNPEYKDLEVKITVILEEYRLGRLNEYDALRRMILEMKKFNDENEEIIPVWDCSDCGTSIVNARHRNISDHRKEHTK